MPRALVTGGAGFIGSNLALELERRGYDVVVADHRPQPENLRGFGGEFLELDVSRPFRLQGPLDAIFHQAALTDPRHANDAEMMERNLGGFTSVLALSREKGATLVYASTAGLYGNGPVPMAENHPPQLLTAYGQSKWKMEEMAREASERSGEIRLVGLRYFNVFGPREAGKGKPASMILHLGKQMAAGERPKIFTHGEQKRDHIYVADVVEANLCALTAPSGVYNVGTGVGTSFNELVAALNQTLGTRLEPEYIPMPYLPESYQHNTQADPRLAEEKLRFTARWRLHEGIADYFEQIGLAGKHPV